MNKKLGFALLTLLALALVAYFTIKQPEQRSDAPLETTAINVEFVVGGLHYPWALEWLPDNRFLVTERSGSMRIIDANGDLSASLHHVPDVFFEGQGGLLDVIADPDFINNQLIYFSYAEPGKNGQAGTAVARATLGKDALQNVTVIFRQRPKVTGGNHFGSRLSFHKDGTLFIGLGDRFNHSEKAQKLDNHMGKVVRILPDGSIPDDNPFVGKEDAKEDIWSYGHRNIQGMAVHPVTGEIWIHEHGPRGGDEINIPRKGKNYGWPEASYGSHYTGIPIEDAHSPRGFVEPLYNWTPSIAPSGMWFYTGDLFKGWQGNLLIGALAGQHLVRLKLDGEKVVSETQLLADRGERIRDITQGPDGAIYVLIDSDEGKLLKLTPR